MARREVEWFHTPVYLVAVAGNELDAKKIEGILTDRGVDYAAGLEDFRNESLLGTVFGGTYKGLFFYVPASFHHTAARLLEEAGVKDIVPLNEEERS